MTEINFESLKIVVLAGGVGGSKMVNGLAQLLPPENLFIVANTADDFEHLGLCISPDLDTIMYTLAGVNNLKTGWGRADETWQTMEAVQQLNGPTWFNVGDKDLANNLLRTQWRRQSYPLSWITAQLCRRFGVKQTLMPMTDSPVQTILHTDQGKLAFQDYFVRRRCQPVVSKIEYEGVAQAEANREILNAIRLADLIVLAPSNPLLSLDPILALPGLARLIKAAAAPVIGISPLIGGKAVRGPAAKLMWELDMEPSPVGVAQHLWHVLSGFVMDSVDRLHRSRVEALGMRVLCTGVLMTSLEDQARLAAEVVEFGLAR
jgi:LPPG:FO 2-phospho-L-lactate transferase